jgi:hypothetical protein
VLTGGWISIVGQGDELCWFLWMSSPDGDGRSWCEGCQQSVEIDDLSFCLIGDAGGVFGACCDLLEGTCQDGVEISDCAVAGFRFVPEATCDELDPPCEQITGACCVGDGTCFEDVLPQCVAVGGTWLGPGSVCAQCPAIGACCLLGDGACSLTTELECQEPGAIWLGAGTTCQDCPSVPQCPPEALFGQSPEGPDEFLAGTSEQSAGFERFEDFSGVAGAIESVTWWGLDLDNVGGNQFVECEEPDPTFVIAFHEDAGGVPGAVVCSEVLTATRTPLGILYLGAELNEYHVELPVPCVLTSGWISIVGLGDPECWFLWMSSGIGSSYCQGCQPPPQDIDLSVCLNGIVGGVFGACCNDVEGTCSDGVEISECVGEDVRFLPEGTCADLDPPCGVVLGACCLGDGTCSLQEEEACAELGGQWLGANSLCDQCPCAIACPPDGTEEGEPDCETDYVDIFNGGCTAAEPMFSPISIGQTVCGASGVYKRGGGEIIPDLDWYEVTVTQPVELTWSVQSPFEPRLWLIDAEAGCPGDIIAEIIGTECDGASLTFPVQSGVYWLVVLPLAFNDTAACPAPYTATLTAEAVCPGDTDGSGMVDAVDLINVILDWGCTSPPGPCPGDVNLDGIVDVGDLVLVILSWGGCE